MRPISLKLKLTLIFTLLVAVACGAISLTLYRSLQRELIWRDDITLVNRAAQLAQLVESGADINALPTYVNRMMDARQDLLQIARPDGQLLVDINRSGLVLPAGLHKTRSQLPPAVFHWQTADGDAAAVALAATRGDAQLVIRVARLSLIRTLMLKDYLRESVIISLLAILSTALLSPWLIGKGLAALGRLSDITAGTDSRNLQQPIEISQLPVELRSLGGSLNLMRQRLACDFTRLTQFADDLAHELRTPVNVMMGENEVALQRPRSPAEYQEIIASNIEELSGISRLIENILFLARAEHKNVALQYQPLALEPFMQHLCDFLEPLAEEHQITLVLEARGEVVADRLLLQRALVNLITNAIRYSPAGSRIQLRACPQGNEVAFCISNPGAELDPQAALFTRFWRGDNARHTSGTGLGLSLVKAIADLHNGSVAFQRAGGQNCFTLTLPQQP